MSSKQLGDETPLSTLPQLTTAHETLHNFEDEVHSVTKMCVHVSGYEKCPPISIAVQSESAGLSGITQSIGAYYRNPASVRLVDLREYFQAPFRENEKPRSHFNSSLNPQDPSVLFSFTAQLQNCICINKAACVRSKSTIHLLQTYSLAHLCLCRQDRYTRCLHELGVHT